MEISLLKVLLGNISYFLHLSSLDNITLEPVQKYYQREEEILKLFKPILDAIADSEIATSEVFNKAFEELARYVDESREIFGSWQTLSSKVYFVFQIESLLSKIQSSILDILQLLKSSHELRPVELSPSSIEHCNQKIKHMGSEQISPIIKGAIKDQRDGIAPTSETLVKIADSLGLRSNQKILIEAVALEKLKENAEQDEHTTEVDFIDQVIAVITRLHDRLIYIKQSQTSSPVPIPADFCCPLSLELMTDPVIVESGQTYERAFIKKWIDLGLMVCPKTRQTLAHSTLIPNYTVKALIASWCESNNVRLPDPISFMSLNQPPHLHALDDYSTPREIHDFSQSRSNQPISTDLTQSTSASLKNLSSSSEIDREGSTHLPQAISESSSSGAAENVRESESTRLSLNSSEDESNSEERTIDQVAQLSISSARTESSNSSRFGQLSQNHNRYASGSNTLLSADSSPTDANENSEESTHTSAYNSDCSGEMRSEMQAASTLSTPQREPEFSPRFMDIRVRGQTIWRRPSERFVPRIVSPSAMETRADLSETEAIVQKLVEDLRSPSLDNQRAATAELRLLAKHNTDNRIAIANCAAIGLLVNLLYSEDSIIQENAVTALLNLSINDNNKAAIGNADAIEPLIHVLETGSPEAKENSAATLFSLSVIEDNKIKIGRSRAIKPLVDLLGNGTPRGKKDAATALFNLSIFHENKARIVQAGAVKYLVELMDPAAGMVDKAVAVLANLSTIQEGQTAIGQEGGISLLVEVVELGSARGKENAAAALLQLCTNSNRFCNMVLQEGAVPPLVALSQSGTHRAKEKAQTLLSFFKNQRHGNPGRS